MAASASASIFAKIELFQNCFIKHLWMVASTSSTNFVNWISLQPFSKDFLIFCGSLLKDWISTSRIWIWVRFLVKMWTCSLKLAKNGYIFRGFLPGNCSGNIYGRDTLEILKINCFVWSVILRSSDAIIFVLPWRILFY